MIHKKYIYLYAGHWDVCGGGVGVGQVLQGDVL